MNRYIVSINKRSGQRGVTGHLPNADLEPLCGTQGRVGFDMELTRRVPKYICGACFELFSRRLSSVLPKEAEDVAQT